MKKLAIAALVLGIVMLGVSFLTTYMVENNETVLELKEYFHIDITPDALDSISYTAEMFGIELDQTTKLGIELYALTPTLNVLGGLLAACGAIGLVVLRKAS